MQLRNLVQILSNFIEEQIRDLKLFWLISIPTTIGTIVVGLGLVTTAPALADVTLVVLALFLGLSVIVLALSRRYLRREIGQKDEVLNRYADQVRKRQEGDPNFFTTKEWREEVRVKSDGDTVVVRYFTLVAGPNSVPTIWTFADRNSAAHLEKKIRDRIKTEVRFVSPDGELGTEIISVHRWETDTGIRVYIHFDRDIEPYEEVKVRLELTWPRYYADLLDSRTEINRWVFRRESFKFDSQTTFESSFAPNSVRVTPLTGSPAPRKSMSETSGSTSIQLILDEIEINKEYGYRIDMIR